MRKNVISLFDGMGIGLLALINLGIRNIRYVRVEIDNKANAAFNAWFTEDKLKEWDVEVVSYKDVIEFPKDGDTVAAELKEQGVWLLLGGSPCTDVSFSGLQKGLEIGTRSSLFFDYVRIKNEFKPEYFLLENTPMKEEFLEIFNHHMGCKPIMINSADFSAQTRKRLYWTNLDFCKSWQKSLLTTEDILEEEVDDKYFVEPTRAVQICDNECKKHKMAYIGDDRSANRIYNIHGKSVTLIANGGGLGAKTGLYALPCLSPDRVEKRQNGRRFKPPKSKFYTLTTIDRHGVLTGNYIRRLTPTECERLQGWPDGMTAGAGSDSQRYKICGNGWTEPVIRHILQPLGESDETFSQESLF
jgi:DNA-cytosine methyltransferase